MHNPSDTEITKALECCSRNRCTTDGCPLAGNRICMTLLTTYALDLINRQQAKIERLKQERDKEHNHCNHYARMCAKAKSEARKEFAERLKESSHAIPCFDDDGYYSETDFVKVVDIDNLLKEMG